MANKEIERKIAVIFATDVVGYSKSVEKNEEQTIKNFRSCRKYLKTFSRNTMEGYLILPLPDQWKIKLLVQISHTN